MYAHSNDGAGHSFQTLMVTSSSTHGHCVILYFAKILFHPGSEMKLKR